MPYIVTTSKCPSHKLNEAAETYLELSKKYPFNNDLYNLITPGAVKATEQGMQTIAITEPKEGKLQEALEYEMKSMAMFYHIEGYECTVEVQMTVEEAFASIDMTTPEGGSLCSCP